MAKEKSMAPRSATPDLVKIEIRVPANLLKEALAVAEGMGLKPGDFHRDLWIEGAMRYAEKFNKVLYNKSLREKYYMARDSDDEED